MTICTVAWSPARIHAANQYARGAGRQGFVAHEVFWNIGSGNLKPGTSQAHGYFQIVNEGNRPAAGGVQNGIYATPGNEMSRHHKSGVMAPGHSSF